MVRLVEVLRQRSAGHIGYTGSSTPPNSATFYEDRQRAMPIALRGGRFDYPEPIYVTPSTNTWDTLNMHGGAGQMRLFKTAVGYRRTPTRAEC